MDWPACSCLAFCLGSRHALATFHWYQTFRGMVAEKAPAVGADVADVLANCAVRAILLPLPVTPRVVVVEPDNKVPKGATDCAKFKLPAPTVGFAPTVLLSNTPKFCDALADAPVLSKSTLLPVLTIWFAVKLTPMSHLVAPVNEQLVPSEFLRLKIAVAGVPKVVPAPVAAAAVLTV